MKKTSYIVTALLWLLSVLLAGICLSILKQPLAISQAPPSITTQQPVITSTNNIRKSVSEFATITKRPLFHANRKPVTTRQAPAPVVPQKKPQNPPDFVLTAVIMDGGISIALLRLSDNTSKRVHSGSIIGDWRVKEIRRRSIVVTNTEKDWIITMAKSGHNNDNQDSGGTDLQQLQEYNQHDNTL